MVLYLSVCQNLHYYDKCIAIFYHAILISIKNNFLLQKYNKKLKLLFYFNCAYIDSFQYKLLKLYLFFCKQITVKILYFFYLMVIILIDIKPDLIILYIFKKDYCKCMYGGRLIKLHCTILNKKLSYLVTP